MHQYHLQSARVSGVIRIVAAWAAVLDVRRCCAVGNMLVSAECLIFRHADARRFSCSASDSRSSAEGAIGSSTAQAVSETPTQRRLRESQRVEERVEFIYNKEDWDQRTAAVRT